MKEALSHSLAVAGNGVVQPLGNDGGSQEGQHLAKVLERGVTPFSEPIKCPEAFGDAYLCPCVLSLGRYT